MLKTTKSTYKGAGIYDIKYTPKGGSYLDTMHYIGSSVNIRARIEQHIAAFKHGDHPGQKFQDDFNNHADRFTFVILQKLDSPTQEELWKAETVEVDKHPRNRLYNTALIPHAIPIQKIKSGREFCEALTARHFAVEIQRILAAEERYQDGCPSYEGITAENALEIAKKAFVKALNYFSK